MAATTDPNLSYYAQIQADLASKDPGTAMTGALAASTAPAVAQAGLGLATTEQQMGQLGPELQQQGDYASMMAGYQLGGLGINQQQSALSQQATEQQYGLTQQSQQEQAQKNQLNYTRQLQNFVGGSAASGALNTEGAKQGQADIGQQAKWSAQDLSRSEQMSAGDYARAQQNFALMAKANGLSQQEVYTRLQYGLSQMGESADPSQLAAQAGNAMSGAVQGVGGTLSQAGVLGNMNSLAGLG